MKNIARLAALAIVVAAPLALAGSAQAADFGSIAGTVWHDVNSNGLRDAGEPVIAGQWMYIDGTSTAVQSDADGHYEFKNLAVGSYRIGSADRSLSHGQGWTTVGGDSKFRADNGKLGNPVVLGDGQQVKNLDSGFATAAVDYVADEVYVSNPHPKVGDVINILGAAHPSGNVWDQFGGQLSLPEGLKVVQRIGGMPQYYATEPAGKVTGFFYDRRSPGAVEFVGARVVVEKELSGAEIKFDVWKGLYHNTDTNTANDVTSTTLTTS
jgi:hypothetical protein